MTEPDAMDLAQIGEALADEFTHTHPDPEQCDECGRGGADAFFSEASFDSHGFPEGGGKRRDGERLVELLERLGFEIVKAAPCT